MSQTISMEEFIHTVHPRFGVDTNYCICVFSKSKFTVKKEETLESGQVIKREFPVVKNAFFTDIDKFNDYIYENRNSYNLYYSLAQVDGVARKEENIISVSSIVMDFDFHNRTDTKPKAQEISAMIRSKMKMYITSIVDSGHGFQVIIPIEETTDIERWNKLIKNMINFFDADVKASNKTQVMRLPNTFNYKDPNKPVPVNAVYLNKGPVYTLEKLEKLLYNAEHSTFSKTISDIKPCIKNMMKGAPKGHRNFCLGRITAELVRLHYSYEEAEKAVLNFNSKCNPPKLEPNVINDFKSYWKGITHKKYNLYGCTIKDANGNVIKSQNDILQSYCNKKECNRSDKVISFQNESQGVISIPSLLCNPFLVNGLNGNELALSIEIYLNRGLTKDNINSNYSLSKPTVNKCINTLLNRDLILKDNNIFKLKSNTKDIIEINPYICNHILNKKTKASLLPVYLLICYLNNNKDYPSVIKISQLLNANKGNISKAVNELIKNGYIRKNMSAMGAGVCYHLSIA